MTPRKESYRTIDVGKGRNAIVDSGDYDRVSSLSWNIDRLGYPRAHLKNGYSLRIKGIVRARPMVRMHQFIMNARAGVEHDHRDGNKLNNRRNNIRVATRSQNMANVGPRNGRRYKGTEKYGKRWRAVIRYNRKAIHEGPFNTEEEAALAYNKLAVEFWGDFAWLNKL